MYRLSSPGTLSSRDMTLALLPKMWKHHRWMNPFQHGRVSHIEHESLEA